MARSDRMLGDVLGDLVQQGHVEQSDKARIVQQLTAVFDEQKTPWYLQPFIFLGALVAAVMFNFALFQLLDISHRDEEWLFCCGVFYLAVAVFLHRRRLNVFTDALALALSLGGHGFVIGGVLQANGEFMACFQVMLGICVILYGLYRNPLHRYLTCLLVLVLAKAAFPHEDIPGVLHVFVLLTTVLAAFFLTRNRELPGWQPLVYACCTGLVILLAPVGGRHGFHFLDEPMPLPWISSCLVGLALLWILHWACRRPEASQHKLTIPQQALAVLVTAGLAATSTPGLLAALFLAALGHATYHWQITTLGLVSLPVFLWKYYYSLEIDFLAKSGVLVASGALLLVARWAITHSRWLRPDVASSEEAA